MLRANVASILRVCVPDLQKWREFGWDNKTVDEILTEVIDTGMIEEKERLWQKLSVCQRDMAVVTADTTEDTTKGLRRRSRSFDCSAERHTTNLINMRPASAPSSLKTLKSASFQPSFGSELPMGNDDEISAMELPIFPIESS